MTELEQIRNLNLENVQPEDFVEIGNDVVQALRDVLGDEAVREIYEASKGDSKDGFGERFADALERYTEIHADIFSTEEAEPEKIQSTVLDIDLGPSLDELREKYRTMQETHLSRNIFVSWEKLRVDIAARHNNEVGADGKYKVSGGTIAVDILGIIRGNIFETIIEEVLRGILDSIFPAEKDPVTTDDANAANDIAPMDTEVLQQPFIDSFGVHDTGFVEDASALDRDSVAAVRTANPLYGQHFGFDMTRDSVQSGSMKIWRSGFHQNIDAVINGEVRSVGIPRISMVELGHNLYHVSPFGKVLNSEIKNPKAELPIGSTIERLDISTGSRRQVFEAQAAEQGCTVDELKARYTAEVQEAFIARVENGLEAHAEYLKETSLPEIERLHSSLSGDRFLLDSRETAIKAKIERIPADSSDPDQIEKRQALEEKLDRISEHKIEVEQGIHRLEDREARIQATLEQYSECKEALALRETDIGGRYMMVSNLEKEAAGRTEITEYIPRDVDRGLDEFLSDERKEFTADIERYNKDNPDEPLREKDGHVYNRFGVSENGDFVPDMCNDVEKPELESIEDQKEYAATHASDGFTDFKEYLEKAEKEVDKVDVPENENDSIESNTGQEVEAIDKNEEEENSDLVSISPVQATDALEDIADDPKDVVEQSEIGETIDNSELEFKENTETKREREEGGYDGDIQDIENEEEEAEKVTAVDNEPLTTPIEPIDAAVSQETALEIPNNEEKREDKKEDENIEKEKKEEDIYDDIISGFREYLENDTYSFSGDLVSTIENVDTQVADQIMSNALRDLYLETDMSQNDRLFALTAEVAIYSDQGVMPVIEELISGLRENGLSDSDIAQTIIDMEPYIIQGMDDLISITADDVEKRIIHIGEEIWTVSPNSIVNDVTGLEEDPNNLVDLIVQSVNDIYGTGVGDTAAEQAIGNLEGNTDKDGVDFLDEFFNHSLQSTLHQMMIDLIPEDIREDFATADQAKDFMSDTEFDTGQEQFEGMNESMMIDESDPFFIDF